MDTTIKKELIDAIPFLSKQLEQALDCVIGSESIQVRLRNAYNYHLFSFLKYYKQNAELLDAILNEEPKKKIQELLLLASELNQSSDSGRDPVAFWLNLDINRCEAIALNIREIAKVFSFFALIVLAMKKKEDKVA